MGLLAATKRSHDCSRDPGDDATPQDPAGEHACGEGFEVGRFEHEQDTPPDPASFYDNLAEYYDLIYADWEASMRRHGAAISAMLGGEPSGTRILDVSSGIGTQALPLAALGHEVVARDVSHAAIRRLQREARMRRLKIDAAVADMREVPQAVEGLFDAVISFDNALPHLMCDREIESALRSFRSLLAPGGVILVSVRDYEAVDRSLSSVRSYGERERNGVRHRVRQEWEWYDAWHYRMTMIVETARGQGWEEVVRAVVPYYAIGLPRLLQLMDQSGLRASRVEGHDFFQPVLRGDVP